AEAESNLLSVCAKDSPRISHLFFADDSLVFTRATIQDAEILHRILSWYERASSQKINLEKSVITLSLNTDISTTQAILQILGLTSVQSHDRYLGLPSVVSRNKRKTFEYILERIRKRVQSWRRGLFSSGGREILIKAVLQSIPTYVMSIFKLPYGLCKEIRSLFLNF
ncbi:LOW QUALITY PROTEIN: hypothetical protein TorRG33x02_001510, partial [Trema orientale]